MTRSIVGHILFLNSSTCLASLGSSAQSVAGSTSTPFWNFPLPNITEALTQGSSLIIFSIRTVSIYLFARFKGLRLTERNGVSLLPVRQNDLLVRPPHDPPQARLGWVRSHDVARRVCCLAVNRDVWAGERELRRGLTCAKRVNRFRKAKCSV